jgi:nucleotide-binding universal stress UspA family protein
MTDTILIGIDGSKAANMRNFAVSQAKSAIQVWFSPMWLNGHLIHLTPPKKTNNVICVAKKRSKRQERVLNPILKSLESEGIKTLGVVRHGQVADVLLQLAKKHGAGQIVVGRIGHSGSNPCFLEVLPRSLIQLAHIPVTIVP